MEKSRASNKKSRLHQRILITCLSFYVSIIHFLRNPMGKCVLIRRYPRRSWLLGTIQRLTLGYIYRGRMEAVRFVDAKNVIVPPYPFSRTGPSNHVEQMAFSIDTFFRYNIIYRLLLIFYHNIPRHSQIAIYFFKSGFLLEPEEFPLKSLPRGCREVS